MDSTLNHQGQVVGRSYNAGYVILSFFVSFVGCWTSLKLLHRRTSPHGIYNWYLLVGAAVSMGAVSIWSTHCIANLAIVMGNGDHNLQIQYNAAYAAGSFFLPVLVVSIAFYLLGLSEEVKITRILFVGLLTGAAVCGMHYLGQGGITNYLVSYHWQYIVGAAFVAVTAATVALGVFFYLKATWTNNWMKRGLCASALAASVSGMHWVATIGTIYRYRKGYSKGNGLTRKATVVVVLCLALGCCIALLTFAIVGQRVKNRSAHRVQQVVLASVIFDTEGKLMVTPEGRLPCRTIAKTSMERNFDEVFAWIYRASHHWPAVIDLIPGFKAHLGATEGRKMSQSGSTNVFPEQMMLSNLEEEANSGTKFKELFCVAANELAECIHEPLISLGVLFESIMLTGTIDKPRKWFPRPLTANSLSHAEHGRMHPAFGRGQVLFLVRQANKRDAAQFQAAGFNFAYLTHIIPSLAQSMEVTIGELSGKLHRIYRSLPYQSMIGSGVHIACYALRPKFPLRGWDILINEDRRNLLPSVRLTTTSLQSWQMGILTKLDNMTAKECNLYLQHRISDAQGAEKAFLSSVDRAIGSLAAQIEHPLFDNARFRSHPYEVPCESLPGSQRRAKATVMMFRVIADAHYSSPLNGRFEFGSSRLFRAQQHVYPRSPDHGAFARQVHLEFAGLAEGRTEAKATSPIVSGYSTPRKPSKSSEGSSPAEPAVGTNGEHDSPFATSQWSLGKVGSEKKKPGQGYNARSFFGGIHVQNEISVDVSEVEERPNSKHSSELSDLGMHSEVTVAPTEIDTFADELMLLLIEERRQQSVRGRTV